MRHIKKRRRRHGNQTLIKVSLTFSCSSHRSRLERIKHTDGDAVTRGNQTSIQLLASWSPSTPTFSHSVSQSVLARIKSDATVDQTRSASSWLDFFVQSIRRHPDIARRGSSSSSILTRWESETRQPTDRPQRKGHNKPHGCARVYLGS